MVFSLLSSQVEQGYKKSREVKSVSLEAAVTNGSGKSEDGRHGYKFCRMAYSLHHKSVKVYEQDAQNHALSVSNYQYRSEIMRSRDLIYN